MRIGFHFLIGTGLFAVMAQGCSDPSREWVEAINKRDEVALRRLARTTDINKCPRSADGDSGLRGMSPLGYAAFECNDFAVKVLLSLGADVYRHDETGHRAIDWLKARSNDTPGYHATLQALRKDRDPSKDSAIPYFFDQLIRPRITDDKIEYISVNDKEPSDVWKTVLNGLVDKTSPNAVWEVKIIWQPMPNGFGFKYSLIRGLLDGMSGSGQIVIEDGYWMFKELEHWDS